MVAIVRDQSCISEFCCVRCGANALVKKQQILHCQSCGTKYPIVHDVPILFPDVVVTATDPSKDISTIVAAVCNYQKLPKTRKARRIVKAIFSKKYRFADFLLNVESQQYLDRMSVSQPQSTIEHPEDGGGKIKQSLKAIKQSLKAVKRVLLRKFINQPPSSTDTQAVEFSIDQPQTATPQPATPQPPLTLEYAWVNDYLPRQMVVNQSFTGNVRLQNMGNVVISSQGPTPLMISYHWLTQTGEPYDSPDAPPEHRTPFPIDLQPGQQITIPMLIETPKQIGQYQLQLCLVEEYVQWHESNAVKLAIEITHPPQTDPTGTWQQTNQIYNYYDDHQRGIALLKAQLAQLANPQPKILEIGGNACPMLSYDFSGQLYNLDIDVHGLQIGKLTSLQQGSDIEFLCADANNIPFPDNHFDCITIFASLHHFPDLRVMLRSLAQKIHSQGFLAIMCEPVGHYYGDEIDPLFREELLKGVNEQSFSLAEYASIFQAAGLVPEEVIVDGCSLKAFLKRRSESQIDL